MPFFITICYTILIFTRPQEWIPFLNKAHPVDLVAIGALWVVGTQVFFGDNKQAKLQFWNSPQVCLVLMLWAWTIIVYISQFFIAEIINTWELIGKKTLIFCLIVVTVNTRKRFEILLWTLVACYLLLGFHGFLQKMTGSGLGGIKTTSFVDGNPRIRAFGIFAGSNELGAVASYAIVLGLGIVRAYGLNLFKSTAGAFVSIFMSFVLFWTQSRQSMLNIAVGASGLFLPKKLRYAIITLSFTGLIFVTAISFHGRWQADLGEDNSVSGRVSIITKGLSLFKSSPIFGVGTYRSGGAIDAGIPPHNSFLMVLVDNGLPGFTIWMGIFVVSFLQIRTIMVAKPDDEEDKKLQKFASPTLGLLLALMCSSYFTNRPYHPDLYFYWGLFAAYGSIAVKDLALEERPLFFQSQRLFGKLGLIVLTSGILGVTGLHLTSRLFRLVF